MQGHARVQKRSGEATLQAKGHSCQRKEEAAAPVGACEQVSEVLRGGGGQALSPQLRAFFEPRFAFDFGRVRVHTDGRATRSARDIGARAYTVGTEIVFGAGAYAPETYRGQKLLAHELAHVVQQAGGGIAEPRPFTAGEQGVLEADADHAAEAAFASAEQHRAASCRVRDVIQRDFEIGILWDWLENESDRTIWVKPEEERTAVPVPPRQTYSHLWDGIATHLHRDRVFKAPTLTRAKVREDGSIITSLYGMALGADWRDLAWRDELHVKGDHGWDALFDRAASAESRTGPDPIWWTG